MSSPKLPRITNIWSKVAESVGGGLCTRVVVESTGVFEYQSRNQCHDIVLEITGAAANMPIGLIDVNDGLVREVSLSRTGPGALQVVIYLDHPARYEVAATGGIPARTTVSLDRTFLFELLQGKKIVIDPGHGGADQGGRGPVNLLEKNVVMPIAKNLAVLFGHVGAHAVLTRKGDEDVPGAKRLQLARKEGADLFIGIHTHSHQHKEVGGISVLYAPSSPESLKLASQVKDQLIKKLRLADRGLQEKASFAALDGIPAIEAEVVTITNWVEEGLLRSPTIHKKAAQGIFNGVKNYFADNLPKRC